MVDKNGNPPPSRRRQTAQDANGRSHREPNSDRFQANRRTADVRPPEERTEPSRRPTKAAGTPVDRHGNPPPSRRPQALDKHGNPPPVRRPVGNRSDQVTQKSNNRPPAPANSERYSATRPGQSASPSRPAAKASPQTPSTQPSQGRSPRPASERFEPRRPDSPTRTGSSDPGNRSRRTAPTRPQPGRIEGDEREPRRTATAPQGLRQSQRQPQDPRRSEIGPESRRPVRPAPRRDPATYEPVYVNQSTALLRTLVEWVVVIAVAVIATVVIQANVVQAYEIPSGSMEPTLMVHDKVVVNKLAYKFGGHPGYGDVVVFKRPPSEPDPTIHNLIKRVIGLPGDRLQAINCVVYRNGKPLTEPYLPAGTCTDQLPLTTVPPGQIFFMGDNRGNSEDSRFIGSVDEKLVVGKAEFRVWPLNRLGKGNI
jgi:signal peptidase I